MLIGPHQGFRAGTHDFRECFDVRVSFEGRCGKRMPQIIGPQPPGDARFFKCPLPGVFDGGYGPVAIMDEGAAFVLVLGVPGFHDGQ